ncbi:hypothetical protein CHS0354_019197 [Potamilus streckersoni]|uniref:Uncharacterized protein n=1 Tax=Potamilus streckersoni TaxID=2493646 RepID=A0AAE0SBF6_9BIVA|nr:hypothetical protein CHS0354_019197 [Potamilus streckersoni]
MKTGGSEWYNDSKGLRLERYCEPCGVAICPKCEVLHHEDSKRRSKHGVKDLKDVAHHHQADIANILSEIKKKSLDLNDKIHLQADVLSNVQENQTQAEKELDQTFSCLMSIIRQKQDALRRNVTVELEKLKEPIENEQRKLKKLRTVLQEFMKSLTNIKRNKDMTHQIKKMKDIKKQLHSLLCFDFAWNLSERTIPTIDLPQWNLIGLTETEAAIQGLHWKGNTSTGPKPKCVDTGCQTDFRDSAKETHDKLKSKKNPDPVHGQGQTAMMFSSDLLVNGTPQPLNMENKMSDQSSAAFTTSGDTRSSFTFMSPPTVLVPFEVPATSFTNSFLTHKNWSKHLPVTEDMAIASSTTAEQLGIHTQFAFPTTAIQNGIPAAKTKGFVPTASTQDGLPEAKTPGYVPRAATQNNTPGPKTQGFAPMTFGLPKAATPVGLTTSSAQSGLPSVTFPIGLTITGSPLASGGLATATTPDDLLISVTPSGEPTTSIGLHMAAVSVGLPTTAILDGLLTHVTPSNSTAAMPGELQTTATPVILQQALEPISDATGRQLTDISSQSKTYSSDIETIPGKLNSLQITASNPQQMKESKIKIPQRSPPFTFESYQKEKQTSQINSIEEERFRESSLKSLPSVTQQINKSLDTRSESNSGSLSTDSLTSHQINGPVSANNGIMVSNESGCVTIGTNAGGASSVDIKSSIDKSLNHSNNTQSLVSPSGQEISAADAQVYVADMYSTFPSAADKKGTKASIESSVTVNNRVKTFAVSSNFGSQTGEDISSTLAGTSHMFSTHYVQSSPKPSSPETSSLRNPIRQNGCQTSVDTSLTDNQNAWQGAISSQLSSLNFYQSGQNNFIASAGTSLTSNNEISQNGVTSAFASLDEPENQYGKRNPASSLSRESAATEHQSSLKMGNGNESTFSKQPISVSLNFFSEDEGRKILKAKRKQTKIKQK